MKIPKLNGKKLFLSHLKQSNASTDTFGDCHHIFYSASHFHHMLRIEKKRTARSHKPFLLVLFDISELDSEKSSGYTREKLKNIIISCSRDTDIRGWFQHNMIIGTIYTEMASVDASSIETIFRKVQNKIGRILGTDVANKIKISIQPITPNHSLPLMKEILPDKMKQEETRKKSETFSQFVIYNKIIVH